MMKMRVLARAIVYATLAHEDQFDRAGKPYILHPLKLQHWLRCHDETTQVAAILHDVVEDTAITLLDIEKNFGPEVARVVGILTKPKQCDYDEYIRNISTDRRATLIKLCDLRHNSDIRRLKGSTQKDFERIQKYQTAYAFLKEVAAKNNWI